MRCPTCATQPGGCWPGRPLGPDDVCGCPCHPENRPDPDGYIAPDPSVPVAGAEYPGGLAAVVFGPLPGAAAVKFSNSPPKTLPSALKVSY